MPLQVKKGQTVEYYQECLRRMFNLFNEKRTDVEDCISNILSNNNVNMVDLYSESRYTRFNYGGADFLYDSLTTLVETNGKPLKKEICSVCNEEWVTLECNYDNDEDTGREIELVMMDEDDEEEEMIMMTCEDCECNFPENAGRPYKYERSIWLCDDCSAHREE